MIKAQRIGLTIICVIGEKMFQKTCGSDAEVLEVYDVAMNTDENDSEDLNNLKSLFYPTLTSKEEKEKSEFESEHGTIEQRKPLLEWMDEIKSLGDEHFELRGISLYMKNIGITIPEFLAREFAIRRKNEEDLKAMMNFWRLLSLNSDPRCREDLYKFLINNHMVVTPSGYFLAYRNANVMKEGNRKLNEFVGRQIIKIKNWKKSPKNYQVLENENGEYVAKEQGLISKFFKRTEEGYISLGNLQELHDKLSEDREDTTVYTDARSRTTTIILGQPVAIDRSDCDADPDRTCSKGLHLGSTNFMSKGYFGTVGLVCLCNPMHVVAVPYTDGQKLRTSEYLPIGIAEYGEDAKLIPVDAATFEYEYAEHTDEQLDDMLNNTRFESLKEHKIIPQEMTWEDFRQITVDFGTTTDEMQRIVQNRVLKVN